MYTFTTQPPFGQPGPSGANDTTMQPTQPNPDPQSGITLEDIRMLANIVDLASSRGAFRASEMAAVGNCWDRVTKFLNSADAAAREQQGA